MLFLLLLRQIVRFLSIFPSIHGTFFLLRQVVLFFSSVRPSTVHKQHVWLMSNTESQLFLTHRQGVWAWDSNDGGSLESGPGSWLGDSGHRQEALLEQGLGAEGHPQSAQRCISADQEEELQDHGDSIQLHQGSERERQVAYGNPAGYYDGFRGRVIEVRDQSSPAHKAQEEIRKEGADVFACARSTSRNARLFVSSFFHV